MDRISPFAATISRSGDLCGKARQFPPGAVRRGRDRTGQRLRVDVAKVAKSQPLFPQRRGQVAQPRVGIDPNAAVFNFTQSRQVQFAERSSIWSPPATIGVNECPAPTTRRLWGCAIACCSSAIDVGRAIGVSARWFPAQLVHILSPPPGQRIAALTERNKSGLQKRYPTGALRQAAAARCAVTRSNQSVTASTLGSICSAAPPVNSSKLFPCSDRSRRPAREYPAPAPRRSPGGNRARQPRACRIC